MFFACSSYARLGPGDPFSKHPALVERLKPDEAYALVVTPVFVAALAVLYFLCHRNCKEAKAKYTLIHGAVTGLVLFFALPHVFGQFFKIWMEMSERTSLPSFDFPCLASAKIPYALILLLVWFLLQPIMVQLVGRRREKPLIYSPLYICFAVYSAWFIICVFTPLVIIVK